MNFRYVQVTAPAQIHFGMLAFGDPQVRQFGGVGVMVQQPALQLKLSAATGFEVSGTLGERAAKFAKAWAQWRGRAEVPACRIEVCQAPPPHTGVGTGTQLGLAVAAGLDALLLPECPPASPTELATAAGRGRRSAVGSYGFHLGGLILDPGQLSEEEIAPLQQRIALPGAWRFVLLRPTKHAGLSGDAEKSAFARLPPVPPEATRQLITLAGDAMFPAAAEGRFEDFADAVYQYGYRAGKCFAEVQGCAFASPEIADLVHALRKHGVRGAGQSSWGPTVFAVLPDAESARTLVTWIREAYPAGEVECVTTAPNNSGATIERC